ncbi:hypothetical protein SteCoe_27545 [Stentor coeruleus]|uniref:Importin N-terminal domain-containing protein n=1 Tax=Stentor coeruleus TaxID=5963 RepID=A0A1R2BA98_9CILI|nr:hypothetical protein SteCoe_27545 [Stentor coeruleus]
MVDAQICEILKNLLNADKQTREVAEQEIQSLKLNTPDLLISSLTSLLLDPIADDIKSLSAVLLKQYLASLWVQLDRHLQYNIKQKLLDSLQRISNISLLKKCCDVISEISIQTYKEGDLESRSHIVNFLMESLESQTNSMIFSSFQILLVIYPFYIEEFSMYKEVLFQAYYKYLESSECEIRGICIQAFNVMISVVDGAEAMYYAELLQNLLKSIIFICGMSEYLAEVCLKSLRDLAETEPLYFRSRILWCFSFTENICKMQVGVGCKYLCMEFVTLIVENYSQLISQKKIVLEGLFVLFTRNFMEFLCPMAEDVEINYEELFLSLFNRVTGSLKVNFIDIILEFCESLDKSPKEWYFIYISIKCLKSIVKELENSEKLDWSINYIIKYSSSQTTQIRFASYSAIKHLSESFPKHFATKYSDSIIPVLISGFSESQSEILTIAIEASKEFFYYSEGQVSTKHIETLLPAVANLLIKHGFSEKTLGVLESIVLLYRKNLRKYFDELFEKVLEITSTTENKSIQAAGLGCLLSLRKILSSGELKKYAFSYVALLKKLIGNNLADEFVKTHVLNAWKILSKSLRGDLSNYLDQIAPILLLYLQSPTDLEIEEHLETLLALIEASPESFFPYMPTASELIVGFLIPSSSDSVKILACSLAASLVKVIKISYNKEILSGIVPYSKGFISAIWRLCLNENDLGVLIEILGSLRVIVEVPGFEYLNKDEIGHIGRVVIKVIEEISKGKNKEIRENDMKACSQVFLSLFRTHVNNSANLIDYAYNTIVAKFLNESNSQRDKIFALEVLGHILESVGDLVDGVKLKEMVGILIFYMGNQVQNIRIASIEGLTRFFSSVKSEKVVVSLQIIMAGLEKSLNCKEKHAGPEKESAKIAVGVILKHQRNLVKLDLIIPWWVRYLPIRKNKNKARELHDFLADLVINDASVMADRVDIVKFFVSIAFTDVCAKRTVTKIEKIIEMFLESHEKVVLIQALPESMWGKFPRLF